MVRSRARVPERARRATSGRCVSSVIVLTAPANPATILRTSSRVTRAQRTRAKPTAATATTRRSSARAAISRPDSSRRRESEERVSTTRSADSASATDRRPGRVLNHAPPATPSVTVRRVIRRLVVDSGSIRTGPASTRRGCGRKTPRSALPVTGARYRVCKRHTSRAMSFMEMCA